jgi:hypothetical protein
MNDAARIGVAIHSTSLTTVRSPCTATLLLEINVRTGIPASQSKISFNAIIRAFPEAKCINH